MQCQIIILTKVNILNWQRLANLCVCLFACKHHSDLRCMTLLIVTSHNGATLRDWGYVI